jgi:hypothetical protein
MCLTKPINCELHILLLPVACFKCMAKGPEQWRTCLEPGKLALLIMQQAVSECQSSQHAHFCWQAGSCLSSGVQQRCMAV